MEQDRRVKNQRPSPLPLPKNQVKVRFQDHRSFVTRSVNNSICVNVNIKDWSMISYNVDDIQFNFLYLGGVDWSEGKGPLL